MRFLLGASNRAAARWIGIEMRDHPVYDGASDVNYLLATME